MADKCPVCGAGVARARINSAGQTINVFDCGREDNGSTHDLPGCLRRRLAAMTARAEKAEAELDKCRIERDDNKLSGDALMEARGYLKKHLGIECAFFDDCIHNAVAMCLQAQAACAAWQEAYEKWGGVSTLAPHDEMLDSEFELIGACEKLRGENPGQPLLDHLQELENENASLREAAKLAVECMDTNAIVSSAAGRTLVGSALHKCLAAAVEGKP